MKQTLEEAAKEYANENCWIPEELHDSEIPDYMEHFAKHFIAGAEWHAKQSPWISVKERLPEEKQRVLVVRNNGLICESCCNLRNKSWLIYGFGYVYDVVGWMPIPSFDEILEANRDVLERIKEKGD